VQVQNFVSPQVGAIFVTDILRLILLIAFPILALWLPSKMG